MRFFAPRRGVPLFLAAAVLVLLPSGLLAAKSSGPIKAKPAGDVVELFAGIKSGEIEVTFIPKDATEATVLFKNKTDKPVAIKLPDAFAGVPVFAQFGPIGGPAGGRRGGGAGMIGGPGIGGPGIGGPGGAGGNQGLGGGFGMNNGMGNGMGMGFMNVGPDKIGKVKVNTVCLEHGKPDPNPHLKYEIRPIDTFTQNAGVIEVCKMLGRGEMSQNVAQAAAWHLANGLTFDQLAAKNRVQLFSGVSQRFFSQTELQAAKTLAEEAVKQGELESKQTLARARSQSED